MIKPLARYSWIGVLIILLLVNIAALLFHVRLDLTSEKRYTLSAPTKKLLGNLRGPVNITLFLSGDMPAGFRKLAGSSGDLLQEFKETGGANIRYRFEKPGEGLNDTLKNAFLDSLHRLGLNPINVKAQLKEGEGQEQQYIYPGALVTYRDRAVAVDLLQGQSAVNGIASLNNAEALLEYKLGAAIRDITRDTVPLIGYLAGNGEPLGYNTYDLQNTLYANYNFRVLPIDSVPVIPPVFSAVLVAKPTQPFSEEQKLKIDQYIMHGGKVMWMIDNVYAEYDSLQRSQNEFIAFDRALHLEDQLFRYGARINLDLVQDLTCDQLPSVIGSMGGKPQIELLPWPYFPLLTNTSGHPIAKNLDYIVSQFPGSIDTVKAAGIRKTFLLVTSDASKILSSPAKVAWAFVRTQEDANTFARRNIPVAVLLEGKFSSLYSNRVSEAEKSTMASYGQPFLQAAAADGKMIVVADGDIGLNAVSEKNGPLPMGKNLYTGYQYANKEFLLNSIDYLTDNSGILETRSKDYTLRLFDKKKLEEQRTAWQVVNIVVPILIVMLFTGLYQWLRKRRYQA